MTDEKKRQNFLLKLNNILNGNFREELSLAIAEIKGENVTTNLNAFYKNKQKRMNKLIKDYRDIPEAKAISIIFKINKLKNLSDEEKQFIKNGIFKLYPVLDYSSNKPNKVGKPNKVNHLSVNMDYGYLTQTEKYKGYMAIEELSNKYNITTRQIKNILRGNTFKFFRENSTIIKYNNKLD